MKKSMMIFFFLSIFQNIANNLAHPVTPTLIKNLNLGNYMFGVAYAAMAFGQFLFSPFWGKMTKVIGERKQMTIGVLGYALGQFMFMIAENEAMIIVARFIGGVGMSGFTVAALSYLIRISDDAHRGQNLTYYTTITTVCSTLGYLIGGIAGDQNIMLSFLIQIGLLMLIGILYALYVKENEDLQRMSQVEWLKEANPLRAIVDGKEIMTKCLLLIFGACFIASLASTAYDQSFNYYIKDIFNFKPSYNGILKAAVGVISFLANMTVCIRLQRKNRLDSSLFIIFGLCASSLYFFTKAENIVVLLSVNMFYFAVNSLYIPLIQNLCVQASSTTKQGVIMGFFNSMKALGMIVGALMAGFSYNLDPKMPFLIAALFFLISAIVMLMYKKEIKS